MSSGPGAAASAASAGGGRELVVVGGADPWGRPVVYLRPAALDLDHARRLGLARPQVTRYLVGVLEYLFTHRLDANRLDTGGLGPGGERAVLLLDLRGLSLATHCVGEYLEFWRSMVKVCEEHYPERCASVMCLNLGPAFSLAFKLFKSTVNPTTLRKVTVVDPEVPPQNPAVSPAESARRLARRLARHMADRKAADQKAADSTQAEDAAALPGTSRHAAPAAAPTAIKAKAKAAKPTPLKKGAPPARPAPAAAPVEGPKAAEIPATSPAAELEASPWFQALVEAHCLEDPSSKSAFGAAPGSSAEARPAHVFEENSELLRFLLMDKST
mmetsp:Transcript_29326/g.65661  ORF Transcript_29326/g.65661 Transcript_29326/m.65661 type:complete len:329 (-) Transcript_29326:183-1169(-)